MANRYWVGNGGNISDIAHWSASSGGVGGASLPALADNVYFDANSFTLTGQTVTLDATTNCLDMDWTGAINNPTLLGGSIINLYGSLTFIVGMTVTAVSISSRSAVAGKTFAFAGKTISSLSMTIGSGERILLDDLKATGNVTHSIGTFSTNGKSIDCASFLCNSATTRTLTLAGTIITASNAVTFTSTGLTLSIGTSTIIMTGNTVSFTGAGLTFYNVIFSGNPITIIDSNTFNTLTIAAEKTLKLTSGTTQTVTSSLVSNGSKTTPNTLQSVTAGSAATITSQRATQLIRRTSIKDIAFAGASVYSCFAGTNVSGNTGIAFVTKIEIGRIKNDGSFNWYSQVTGKVEKISG